jgi:hypothetical protein
VTSSEPALRALTGKLSALDKRRFSTRAQAAAAECVGELGTPPKERAESVNGARVETWRRLIHDERAASFAVVGPESVSNEGGSERPLASG